MAATTGTFSAKLSASYARVVRPARACSRLTTTASGQNAPPSSGRGINSRGPSSSRIGSVMAQRETTPLGPYCVLPRTDEEMPSQHLRAPESPTGLPAELEAIMNFTDGPRPGSQSNEGGLLSWWRYQGLGL